MDGPVIIVIVGVTAALLGYLYFRRLSHSKMLETLNEHRDDIIQAAYSFQSIINTDQYISKNEYDSWLNDWSHITSLIQYDGKLDGVKLDFISELHDLFNAITSGEAHIAECNRRYIHRELEKYRDFFDTLEPHPLTTSQRIAIVTDEKCNLVVAGAGTGKTSTIVSKAGYLLQSGLAKPNEILLISFARDVKEEMEERVQLRLGMSLRVETFHSLGLSIVAEVEGVKPSLSELSGDKVKLQKAIEVYIQNRSTDLAFLHKLNKYFSYHSTPHKSIYNFRTMGEYYDYLRNHHVRSLKGNLVKSVEECSIANFLYLHGVEYEYEARYEVETATREHRQYRPDFYLPEYGIYIEHLGIDKYGNTAPFVEKAKYMEELAWKRQIHRENRTTLIETYSWWSSEGELLQRLEDELLRKGVVFNDIPPVQIFKKINELGLVTPFSGLLATFLILYKSSGKSIPELLSQSETLPDAQRYRAFLEIFSNIFEDYEESLGDEIDFNDMIIRAEKYVADGAIESGYKYILVDEFQDISYSRYKLLAALLNQNPGTKLFCVGDDWQSIYRFTGSDINIMTDFDKYFSPSERLSLDKTFRFDDKLCDFSSLFIMKNLNQIPKKMTTEKVSDEPSVTLHWSNTTEKTLEKILGGHDEQGENASVFIIGRYNHLEPSKLRQYRYMYRNLDIEYITAHSSKGTEADYVIIIGLTSVWYAFPSQIVDDPILELVLAKKERVSNAEERRLFYVALTRARKHVYLIADEQHPSVFASEVTNGEYEINIEGRRGVGEGRCPVCKTGVILRRRGDYGEFYSCSNYPYCNYRPWKCPVCGVGVVIEGQVDYICSRASCFFRARKCPECSDGYLVERRGPYSKFLGCSNYPACKHTVALRTRRR